MNQNRLVGVTVLPEYIQSEGVEALLDNLERAGVTAVATSPYVMEPADETTGSREPPADAEAGSVRLLDRPLWGKRELWVRTAPSWEPDRTQYNGLRYQPSSPTELTRRQGHVVADFITAAKERGLKVYFQVMAAIPPGYRVQFGGPTEDDTPRLPDGRLPGKRVDKNGSLASEHIVAYEHALIRDLLSTYRDIDGIRFDWPEYPPYLLDSVFLDFCEHARTAAARFDIDFERMRTDVGALYDKLHGGLTDADVQAWSDRETAKGRLLDYLARHPGVADWLRFKSLLSAKLLEGFRRVMDDASAKHVELEPSAFPPPWSIVSGFDFQRAAEHCDAVAVKLYGMHWAMMLRFYGEQLLAANEGLCEASLVRGLVAVLDIADDQGLPTLDDYRYPEPDQPHPMGQRAQARKIAQAQSDAGDCPIHVLAHGYGPADDFRRRIRVACQASGHGFWVNRYAYLSDEKLDIIGQEVRAAAAE
ncbi:MAG: hypothetical protein RIC55_13810 [Pirellulaceae bacterium]